VKEKKRWSKCNVSRGASLGGGGDPVAEDRFQRKTKPGGRGGKGKREKKKKNSVGRGESSSHEIGKRLGESKIEPRKNSHPKMGGLL